MTAKIKLNAASGGGSFSLQAPSSSSNNRVMTLPDTADGTILTTTNPKSGNIIQVVSATTTTAVNNTSQSTYADSGLEGSITLTDASNKVLVMVAQTYRMANATGGQNGGSFRFTRNGSNIDNVTAYLYYHAGAGTTTKYDYGVHSSQMVDTPGAGTHTYKTQTIAYGSGSEVHSQYGGISRMTLLEVAA